MMRPLLFALAHRSIGRGFGLTVAFGLAFGLTACQKQDQQVIPNRVLDRPLDLGLACVQTDGERVTPLARNQCDSIVHACTSQETPQLVGLIANSERNEVALFSLCLGGLVDMDPGTPGYQFIPVGELPSSLSVGADGCRAAVANFGSCDLSLLDVPSISASAFDIDIDRSASVAVATVTPRRADGSPLAARPGQVLMAPSDLTNSASLGDGGIGFDDITGGICGADQPASAYVTFPSCDLIAEVDLLSGRILQSRQLVVAEDGGVDVVDTGSDPECPVECASQLSEAQLEAAEDFSGDPEGVSPQALALVVPPPLSEDGLLVDPADVAIVDSALFVGGAGSDVLVEIPFEGRSFAETSLQLELSAASGILGITPTPAMEIAADAGAFGEIYHQFLYVISGDGSTRVVRRNLAVERDEIGRECDAQIDPTLVTATICNDAAYPGDNPPDRRPFAQGPGIRAPNGAVVTDWTFQRVVRDEEEGSSQFRSPFTSEGVVGIGVTNVGRIVYVTFGQFNSGVEIPQNLDPLGTISAQILPHSLWPQRDPGGGDPLALPRVDDREPNRFLSGETSEVNSVKVLAPSLRRVDVAYADGLLSGEAASPIVNADGLSKPEEGAAIYTDKVARVISRDYREWRSGEWTLNWEGEIPSTSSSTGQLYCDTQGPGEVYCYTTEADGSRLVDSRATFCDEGVLAGDKVLIFGCGDTEDCGIGQICLRDEASQASGICVSAEVYDEGADELREACAEYISDPCGTPQREFLISRAFQTELHLQAMDIPKSAYLEYLENDEGEITMSEREGRLICAEEQPEGGCSVNADCEGTVGSDRLGNEDVAFPLCIDGMCRRACDEAAGEDCVLQRLPGSRCFGELIRYHVRARNSFVVRGPGGYSFLSQRVRADDSGECYEDPTVSNLLTSRIRLGVDEEATRFGDFAPISSCPSGKIPETGTPNPCFITEGRPAQLDFNSSARLFHNFFYQGQRVSAIRYSNPMFSMVLDLTSLADLSQPIPEQEQAWPVEFAAFRRSRIPRSYRESFATATGYLPYNEGVAQGSVPLVGPVRVINGGARGIIYVVDGSGSGGGGRLRGQVMRIFLSPNAIADTDFVVR